MCAANSHWLGMIWYYVVVTSMGDLLGFWYGRWITFAVRHLARMVPAYKLPLSGNRKVVNFRQATFSDSGAVEPYWSGRTAFGLARAHDKANQPDSAIAWFEKVRAPQIAYAATAVSAPVGCPCVNAANSVPSRKACCGDC